MVTDNLLLQIEASLMDLRPSEQKVANYVLKNYEQVKFQTVSELAANSHVSEASVMRFIKRLGFNGFQYFKLSLASMANKPAHNPHLEITEINLEKEIKKAIATNCMSSIEDTATLLETKSLEAAVNLVLNSREILIVGVGSSGIFAQLLAYNFLRMGILTKYISDPHLQAMSSALISADDLVIGISHSGSTRDTIDAIRLAHENQAKTICITGHVKSPIAKYSDVLLCSFSREDPLGRSAGRSSISQIYVIETLTAYIYTQIKDKADACRQITAQSVLGKLY